MPILINDLKISKRKTKFIFILKMDRLARPDRSPCSCSMPFVKLFLKSLNPQFENIFVMMHVSKVKQNFKMKTNPRF